MFFDRYEIHVQAFVHFINGKWIISDPHLHKIIFEICIQNSTNKTNETTWYLEHKHCRIAQFVYSHIDINNIL